MVQPYFIPWISFFSRAQCSDEIVFLDQSLYKRQYYSNRARLLAVDGSSSWFTIPIRRLSAPMSEVQIAAFKPPVLLRKFIGNRSGPFADDLTLDLMDQLDGHHKTLLELNIALLEILFLYLFEKPLNYHLASNLSAQSDRSSNLVAIARALDVQRIVAGWGQSVQVHDLKMLHKSGIDFSLQDRAITLQMMRELPIDLSIISIIQRIGKPATLSIIFDIANTAFKSHDDDAFTGEHPGLEEATGQ